MGIISRLEFSKSLSFHCDFLRIGRIPAKSANSGLSSLKDIFTLLGPVFSILFIFFQQEILSQEIFLGEKNFKEKKDTIFIDNFGREVYFRGWNISGAVKLKSMNYKPFKNIDDASQAFRDLRERTGSNIIRYTLSWEAIHPQVDTINYNYLQEITFQIKEAIKNNIYILLDYHQDLFSRHLFNKNSKFTGN